MPEADSADKALNADADVGKPDYAALLSGRIEAMDRAEARTEEAEMHRRETVEPFQKAALAEVQQPRPDPNIPQQRMPAAPKQNIAGDMKEFLSSAMLIGTLGGFVGRHHATNALNAFSGAMEGYKQNRMDDFEARSKQWKMAVEAMKENNAQEVARYKRIFEDRKMGIEEKQAALQLVASEEGNRVMYEAARAKDIGHAAQLYAQLMWHQTTAENSSKRLELLIEQAKARQAQNAPQEVPITDELKAEARLYNTIGPSALTNLGRGKQSGAYLQAVRGEAARQRQAEGVTEQDLSVRWAEREGLKASERALGTRVASFGMASKEASEIIKIARTTIDDVWRREQIPANIAIRAYETQTGSIDEVKLGAALNAVVNSYARAISPTGTPTVSDKDHAREVLSTSQTKNQMSAVLDMFEREIAAAGRAPGQVKEEIRRLHGTGTPEATPQPPPAQPAAPAAGEERWEEIPGHPGVKVKVQ